MRGVVSAHVIRLAKDACAAANEAKVARNIRTASMIASKSRGDTGIYCGGSGLVEVTGSAGDELKSHLFQSIFLIDFYIKRLIFMQESGINFTKISVQQKTHKKAEIAIKRSRMWPSNEDLVGCSRLQ